MAKNLPEIKKRTKFSTVLIFINILSIKWNSLTCKLLLLNGECVHVGGEDGGNNGPVQGHHRPGQQDDGEEGVQ